VKPKNAITNCSSTMEETRKRGRPCKRWRDEVEEDIKVMGLKNRQVMDRKLLGMEKDCIESQGLQWTVVFVEEE
jgi:hypothetical protein